MFQLNYTKIAEVRKHTFVILPKELFANPRYAGLTNDARIAYALLLDRLSLSERNQWFDKNGNVFLIFTREALAGVVGVSLRTMTAIMKQLAEVELVEEKRQGLNKPNLIYIGQIRYEYEPSQK